MILITCMTYYIHGCGLERICMYIMMLTRPHAHNSSSQGYDWVLLLWASARALRVKD